MGRCGEAIEILDRILIRQPDNVHALTAKGLPSGPVRIRPELAYSRALARDPKIKEAQVFKGMALFFMGGPRRPWKSKPSERVSRRFGDEIDKKDEGSPRMVGPGRIGRPHRCKF